MPTNLIVTYPFGGDPTGTSDRILARDSTGRLWCVHAGFDGANDQMFVSHSDNQGVTWTHEQIANNPGFTQQDPCIAVDSLGRVHVAWTGTGWGGNPGFQNIQYRRRIATGWEAQVGITDVAFPQGSVGIAVDSQNNVYVMWGGQGIVAPPLNEKVFLVIRSVAGWSPIEAPVSGAVPQRIGGFSIDLLDGVNLAFSGVGYGGNPGQTNCQYLHRASGGGWGAQETITDVAFNQEPPRIAIDTSGVIHVAWPGNGWGANPGFDNWQYRQRTPAGWGVQEPITDIAVDQQPGQVIVDINGNVYVDWEAVGFGAFPLAAQIVYRQRLAGVWQPMVMITNNNAGLANAHPSSHGSLWPLVGGLRVNMPQVGLAVVYSEHDLVNSDVYYHYPSGTRWPAAPAANTKPQVQTLPATEVT